MSRWRLRWPDMEPAPDEASKRPLWRRLLWMALIWLISVAVLLTVAAVLRLVLRS